MRTKWVKVLLAASIGLLVLFWPKFEEFHDEPILMFIQPVLFATIVWSGISLMRPDSRAQSVQ